MGMKLDVAPQDLKTIQALLKQYLPHTRVWAFGSRVKFTAHPASDLDVAAFINKEQEIQFSLLKEALEESDLPFRIDLHNWDELPETFHDNIRKNYVEIQSDIESELAGDWKTYKLGNIAELRKEQVASNGVEQPYIGLEHIEQQSLRLNGVGSSDSVVSSKFKFYNGDVLYGRLRPYFRKVYNPKFEGVCSTEIFVIKNKKNIDKDFLYYLVATDEFTNIANSGSLGTHMPRADWKQLEKSEWNIPNLPTQIQIALILSSIDDKIELNLQMNQTLETMAQAIFKEWFVDFNFPGFDGELVDGLPKGWRKVKVNDLCQVNASTLNSKDDIKEVHYIEISEVERGIIKNIKIFERGSEPSRAKRKLQHGDTVLSTVRPDRGSYFLSLYPTENMIASTGFAVFSPTLVPFSFLYLLLTREDQLEYYGKMADGAAYPAINQSVIMDIDFVLPTTEILTLFHKMAGNSLIKLFNNLTENKILSETRDTLLPKLMSGQVKVSKLGLKEF